MSSKCVPEGHTKEELKSNINIPSSNVLQMLNNDACGDAGSNSATLRYETTTTLCPVIDEFLGGGLLTGKLTEISGISSSGKTQLGMQLSLGVQLSEQHGGLSSGAIYICTEDKFPSGRLTALAKHFAAKFPSENLTEKGMTDRVFVTHIADASSLIGCLGGRLPCVLRRGVTRLVVVDSVAAVFRCEEFRGDWKAKDKQLQQLGSLLKKLAFEFRCAVVCINQVTASMARPSAVPQPALGATWAALINSRLMLSRTERVYSRRGTGDADEGVPAKSAKYDVVVRNIEVVLSARLPKGLCEFIVDGEGVKGITKVPV